MVATRVCRLTLPQDLCFALIVVLVPMMSSAAPPLESAHGVQGAAPAGKPRIGRIFFSPSERRHRSDVAPTTDAPRATDNARVERLAVNGVVSSSTKGRAVWINGVPIENSASLKSAWTDSSGRVWLRDDRHIPRRVQPGQAIDPTSGTIEDLLPVGSVVQR
jgi:hypothetical protein